MGQGNHNTDVDPEYLQNAKNLWASFMKFSKISVYIICGILILLAIILL